MKKKKAGPSITLYHFCAAWSVPGIMREGITKGMTPIFDGDDFRIEHGTQWLTSDKDPQRQSWATHNLVSYSRRAYRLTVNIPHSHRKKLHRAADFIKRYPEDTAAIVDAWDGSASWYIYTGTIPPAWIVGVQKMEAAP